MSSTVGAPEGNWVGRRFIKVPALAALALLALSFLTPYVLIGAALCLVACGYFAYARYCFSPKGGDVQRLLQDLVLEQVALDGSGEVLDIGCGDGRVAVDIARRHPNARVTGVDMWGGAWEFSPDACEAKAAELGVCDRVRFQRASAARLPFADESFDLVVSNLVFHEVAELADKRLALKEALRVLRPGGRFVFQDLFKIRPYYGSTDELLATLREYGAAGVTFVDTSQAPFIPTALKLPFMTGTVAMVYGVKHGAPGEA